MIRLESAFLAAMMLVSSGAVQAQDMTGMYFGGHIGGVNASGDYTAFTPRNSFAGFDVQDLDGSSVAGGVQLGYNWDQGSYLLGLEGTLTAMGIDENSTSSNNQGTIPEFGRSLDNLMTVGPKLGIKSGNALFYAKAGFALGRVGASHNQNGNLISSDSTETGWAIGVGAEFPMGERLTARVDYTYADFGSVRNDMAGSPDIWVEQDVKESLFTVGFNYYFK